MCTVTFIPTKHGVFLTSNRDEHQSRSTALTPAVYPTSDGLFTIYPKDPDGGGTWIAAKNNGDAIVLLNGAFEKHIPMPPYRRSRGIILIEIFNNPEPLKSFAEMDLNGIEPFTVIIISNNKLHEGRWNGIQHFIKPLNNQKAQIWSSATLYDNEIKLKREQWFAAWLSQNKEPELENIFNFHLHTGDEGVENNLVMNRNDILKTVSISAISISTNSVSLHYNDLRHKTNSIKSFQREGIGHQQTLSA